jgi:hypothetical protein
MFSFSGIRFPPHKVLAANPAAELRIVQQQIGQLRSLLDEV